MVRAGSAFAGTFLEECNDRGRPFFRYPCQEGFLNSSPEVSSEIEIDVGGRLRIMGPKYHKPGARLVDNCISHGQPKKI